MSGLHGIARALLVRPHRFSLSALPSPGYASILCRGSSYLRCSSACGGGPALFCASQSGSGGAFTRIGFPN